MALAVGDIYEVRLITYATNQVGMNVLHYRCISATGDPINLGEDEVAQQADLIWSSGYKACMSNSAEWVGTGARRIFPTVGLEYIYRTTSGPGNVASDILPRQVTGMITKRTGLSGRKRRGRMYIAFPPETQNDSAGIPTSAYMTGLDALALKCDDFISVSTITPAAAGRLDPIVLSRTPILSWEYIVDGVARQRWATQRRRGSYGRTNLRP